MANDFTVNGRNPAAPFTLKLHRGDGMALIGMDWKGGPPPEDFVGFQIEFKEPGGSRFFAIKNRLGFLGPNGEVNIRPLSSRVAPIQKFRWIHFPFNAGLDGAFTYRVTPVFMDEEEDLGYGEPQTAAIVLRGETYPKRLNVTFTRGFVSSQAFVERYARNGNAISTLLPARAADGITFVPTHPKAEEALRWMGFEARSAILDVLDRAIADTTAEVYVVAYDLSESEIVERLRQLAPRLRIIIDDDGPHEPAGSGESQAERILAAAGAQVRRQHMRKLQHNKTIVVDGKVRRVVCGSTNFSWRGLYVQANNAVVLSGARAVKHFKQAFEAYWNSDQVDFTTTPLARWVDLGLDDVDVRVVFAPMSKQNSVLTSIADDIAATRSSLFYSLAFLSQTPGVIMDAIRDVTADPSRFVYGMADRRVGGLELMMPDGNPAPVFPAALTKDLPEPFKSEPTGGTGTRMHHKFIVIDFDKPTARVYLGSYNFSKAADASNGENLLCIRNRKVATSYMIEALRIFDHYRFRVVQREAKEKHEKLSLKKPPRTPEEKPWWAKDYEVAHRVRDRELFS